MASPTRSAPKNKQPPQQSQSAFTRICCCLTRCFKTPNNKTSESQSNIKMNPDGNKDIFEQMNEDKQKRSQKQRPSNLYQYKNNEQSTQDRQREEERAYKNQEIFKKQDLNNYSSYSFSGKQKTLVEYDNDVEDYFVNVHYNQDLVHQYVSIRQYPENQILLLGQKHKVLFKINHKTLSISPQLSQKIIQSLRKIKNNPPAYPNKRIQKCWKKRYTLFEKFDLGIKFDEESYISTPPEVLTSYLSTRMKLKKIIHVYPDIGAYDMKLSNSCQSIIVTNIKYSTLECLQNNLSLLMIDNVSIIPSDILNINTINNCDIDAVLITPPWGLQYTTEQHYNLDRMQLDPIIKKSLSISSNIVLVLPSNINIHQLGTILGQCLQYSLTSKIGIDSCYFEVEKIVFLNRIRFIVVYYGSRVCKDNKLIDQLNIIYDIVGNDSTEMKKIAKIIKEEYGMYYLLRLVLREELKEGNQFQKLVQIIKREKIVDENKLTLILNNNYISPRANANKNISQDPSSTDNIQRMTYKTNGGSLTDQCPEKQSKYTKKTITDSYASFYQPVSGITNNSRNTINVRITTSQKLESHLSAGNQSK